MAAISDTLQHVVNDRYQIGREIGRGGMATVYLARDLRHDRDVALKVLDPELMASLGEERFLREIRLIARLQHPNILPLHDSGKADGLLYYVTPFVSGDTLRARLVAGRTLPVDEALRLTTEVASALDYAHRQGIVHRDIKPENILLQDSHAMLADFGIARALASAGEQSLTRTGLALGTVAYMSPEQAAGEREIDGRSDLYSLACVLYEMLVGEPPFTGPNAQAVMARRFAEPPPSVRRLRETLTEQLDRTVVRALARDPADRFQTAGHLIAALATAAGDSTNAPVPRVAPVWSAPKEPLSRNAEAREHFLSARRITLRRNAADLATAADHLARAVALDDEFAAAHALMGAVHMLRADLHEPLESACAAGTAAASRALAIDSRGAMAHATLGLAATLSWKWTTPEASFARAVECEPESPLVHQWHAIYLCARGRASEARQALHHARSLDETNTVVHAAAGMVAYYDRDFAAAISALQRACSLEPSSEHHPLLLATALGASGDTDRAMSCCERAINLAGRVDPLALAVLGCTLAQAGRMTDASEMLAQLRSLALRADVSPFYEAAVSAATGDHAAALAALRRAYAAHDGWLLSLKLHPWLDPLRHTRELTTLITDIGL